ncbi:hypothetical protein BJF79_03815 [Actinomadura sp. CNU-125]|uniref:DUF7352 domain-containing protein n=1 Tax=Actinomadura sp. CNU-125 TaxID=1904961 RepID=UPI0009663943|nr:hypothetical protein [Actinomadura sp. CNU-125]OLT13036.1 hypothetical protein BJF79_03815 [Actinomadura sp. CNU-125]
MTERIYRYVVPVDDAPHTIHLTLAHAGYGPLHVAATNDEVEFWAVHSDEYPDQPYTFQVVGTGHPLPPGAQWRGTAPRTPDGLVWHLVELPVLGNEETP